MHGGMLGDTAASTAIAASAGAGTTGGFLIVTTLGLGAFASVLGPVAILAAMVLIGALATLKVFDNEKTLQELEILNTEYDALLRNKPDLAAYINNPVGT